MRDAKVSGNLPAFRKGLRGTPDDVIYDLDGHAFLKPSQWHEYGVGFGQDIGVVSEDHAASWVAEWDNPVEANYIALSGAYPNQPQPRTGWKNPREGRGTRCGAMPWKMPSSI